jgi:hypothetical protein
MNAEQVVTAVNDRLREMDFDDETTVVFCVLVRDEVGNGMVLHNDHPHRLFVASSMAAHNAVEQQYAISRGDK